jgi:hypothetical protein
VLVGDRFRRAPSFPSHTLAPAARNSVIRPTKWTFSCAQGSALQMFQNLFRGIRARASRQACAGMRAAPA